MAAINDWLVNIVNAVVSAFAVNFGVPLLIGFTGSRSIVKWGTGVSEAVAVGEVRQGGFTLIVEVSGSSYSYIIDSGTTVRITVPTTARVRDLVVDFAANASAPVKAIIKEIKAVGTGSGAVSALTATASDLLKYQAIQSTDQIKYYYDSADAETTIITNVLASSPTPGIIYLLDVYGLSGSNLTDEIDAYNEGDWFAACTTDTGATSQTTLAAHFDALDRFLFLTCSTTGAVTRLGLCPSSHVAFLCHDAPSDHPEASWLAKNLPYLPSVIYKGVKDLQGQTANETDSLTTLINIRAAKGNCYVKDSGLSITDGGQTTDPNNTTYIDQTISRLWMKINSILAMKNLFVQMTAQGQRIPYTDAGIRMVIAAVAQVFTNAGDLGVIAPVETSAQSGLSFDGRYRFVVRAATRAEIEKRYPSDIVDRRLRGITYYYVESGAIEGATVTETIVLSEPAAAA